MFQTGIPAKSHPQYTKTGSSIYGTPFEDEIRPTLRHNKRGMVAMANKGPGTNGSQFYITLAAAGHLDGKNTVFGCVLDGEETLGKIEQIPVDKKHKPMQEVLIERVTIHANPLAG